MDLSAFWYELKKAWDTKSLDRPFNFAVSIITTSQSFTYPKGTTALLFRNLGAVTVTVQGITLFPSATPATVAGDSISVGAHKNDIFTGVIKIAFAAGANPISGNGCRRCRRK